MTEPLLRQNKGNYKVIRTISSDITRMSPYLDKVWNEWENEHSELTTNMIYPILKKFISGENIPSGRIVSEDIDIDTSLPYYTIQMNESTLILIGLHSDDQKYLMIACKQMGLQCIPPDPPRRGMCCCC